MKKRQRDDADTMYLNIVLFIFILLVLLCQGCTTAVINVCPKEAQENDADICVKIPELEKCPPMHRNRPLGRGQL